MSSNQLTGILLQLGKQSIALAFIGATFKLGEQITTHRFCITSQSGADRKLNSDGLFEARRIIINAVFEFCRVSRYIGVVVAIY